MRNIGSSGLSRIYLAGPDVFLPNADAMGRRKKRLCATYGFEGVYPLDAEMESLAHVSKEVGLTIGRANEELIRSCNAVIANITPFRGPSADVGTAYEMGFAAGLGLVVCAYTNVSPPFAVRTIEYLDGQVQRTEDGQVRDADGMAIEDWGLVDNLMLDSCVEGSGGFLVIGSAPSEERYQDLAGFEECLQKLQVQVSG